MELLLLVITAVSLVVAFVMSAAAWRVSREARARSAARVAALAAAAGDAPQRPRTAPPQELELGPPATEHRRADTREQRTFRPAPAALAAAAPWSPSRAATARAVPARVALDELPLAAPGSGFLGSAVSEPPSNGRQRGLAVAAIVLFVAVMTGGYLTIFGGDSSTIAVNNASAASPLELVSLRHERRGSRLAITGLVRNPVGGTPIDQLASVVFLFDQQGKFVTSARAEVDFRRLAAGDESPFVVTTEAPETVARYRVSFRTDAGVVAHVDRRGEEPITRELP